MRDETPWVIMCSGTPWAAAAHRQHALARELANPGDDGFRVLFIDPPTNGVRWTFAIEAVDDRCWHATVPTVLPLGRHLPFVNRINRWMSARMIRRWLDARPAVRVLWIDEDLAAPLIGHLAESSVVYDATDLDWTFTRVWNRRNLQRSLLTAVTAADLVLVSSAALPDHLPPTRLAPVVVANACDPVAFEPTGTTMPCSTSCRDRSSATSGRSTHARSTVRWSPPSPGPTPSGRSR